MGFPVVLALASLALGAGELRLDAGLHLDGRGRIVSPRYGPEDRTLEAVAVPRASAEWITPDVRVGGTYSPRLRAPDLLDSSDVLVLHAAELRATLRPDPAWRLSAVAHGERGTTDLLTESRQLGAELQTITTTRQIRYQAARGDLHLEGRITPRTTAVLATGAFVEGGDGAAAEAVNPIQRGVRAEAGLGFVVSRLDRLGLRLSALGARLERGPTSAVATLEAGWHHRFSPTVDGWLGAGMTGAYEEPRVGSTTREVLPTAEVGIAHTPPTPPARSGDEGAPVRETPSPRISSQAALRVSPWIDRATGAVNQRIEGTLRAHWPITPRWSLGAGAIGALVLQSEGNSRLGRVETQATWAASTWAHLGGGIYGSWQRASSPALPSFDEGGVYLSVDFNMPTVSP